VPGLRGSPLSQNLGARKERVVRGGYAQKGCQELCETQFGLEEKEPQNKKREWVWEKLGTKKGAARQA